MNDAFEVQFFGGDQRKSLSKVKPHLIAKYRACACACAVFFVVSVVENMLEEFEIGFHGRCKLGVG